MVATVAPLIKIKRIQRSHEQHRIDAAVQFRVVGDLCVFAPDYLPCLGYQPQLRDVDFDYCALCDHAQRGVQVRLGVFLYAEDRQFERGFQLRVGDICLFEAEACGADEPFVFGWLTSEALTHESYFVDTALPTLAFTLSRANYIEHLCFGHRFDLLNGDGPPPSLLLPLLPNRVGENPG